MTTLPPIPYPDIPIPAPAPVSFQLNEKLFWQAVDPEFSWEFDEAPLFIGDPSPDFIKACQRDLAPLIEELVRGA